MERIEELIIRHLKDLSKDLLEETNIQFIIGLIQEDSLQLEEKLFAILAILELDDQDSMIFLSINKLTWLKSNLILKINSIATNIQPVQQLLQDSISLLEQGRILAAQENARLKGTFLSLPNVKIKMLNENLPSHNHMMIRLQPSPWLH